MALMSCVRPNTSLGQRCLYSEEFAMGEISLTSPGTLCGCLSGMAEEDWYAVNV